MENNEQIIKALQEINETLENIQRELTSIANTIGFRISGNDYN